MAYTANAFGFVFAAMGFTLKSMMGRCCFLSVTVTTGISFFLGLRLKHLNHNRKISGRERSERIRCIYLL